MEDYADDRSARGDFASPCYRLHGVISHVGLSPHSGHYVAHVCDPGVSAAAAAAAMGAPGPGASPRLPQWVTYDDEDVTVHSR